VHAVQIIECVQELIQHGANIDRNEPSVPSALCVAASHGYEDIVKFL
jgi:hypothetical protein